MLTVENIVLMASHRCQMDLDDKNPPAAGLLALDFVVADVTARYGDAPSAPPRPKPKSPAAASLTIFREALSKGKAELGAPPFCRITLLPEWECPVNYDHDRDHDPMGGRDLGRRDDN